MNSQQYFDRSVKLFNVAYEAIDCGYAGTWADYAKSNFAKHECLVVINDECADWMLGKKEYTLTLKNVVKGMNLLKKEIPFRWKNIQEGDYDAIDSDCLLQCALFGKTEFD